MVIKNCLRSLGLFVVLSFLGVVLTPVSNYTAREFAIRPDIKPSGAIVVLGGGVWKGGMLDNESLRRTVHGIELYKNNLAPTIIFSGPASDQEPEVSEAAVRAQLALTMGVPRQAIVEDALANTTREESIRISGILHSLNIDSILLVTESLHMRRAAYVFERAGIAVSPAPSDNFYIAAISSGERLRLSARIAEETAALTYYRLAGYF